MPKTKLSGILSARWQVNELSIKENIPRRDEETVIVLPLCYQDAHISRNLSSIDTYKNLKIDLTDKKSEHLNQTLMIAQQQTKLRKVIVVYKDNHNIHRISNTFKQCLKEGRLPASIDSVDMENPHEISALINHQLSTAAAHLNDINPDDLLLPSIGNHFDDERGPTCETLSWSDLKSNTEDQNDYAGMLNIVYSQLPTLTSMDLDNLNILIKHLKTFVTKPEGTIAFLDQLAKFYTTDQAKELLFSAVVLKSAYLYTDQAIVKKHDQFIKSAKHLLPSNKRDKSEYALNKLSIEVVFSIDKNNEYNVTIHETKLYNAQHTEAPSQAPSDDGFKLLSNLIINQLIDPSPDCIISHKPVTSDSQLQRMCIRITSPIHDYYLPILPKIKQIYTISSCIPHIIDEVAYLQALGRQIKSSDHTTPKMISNWENYPTADILDKYKDTYHWITYKCKKVRTTPKTAPSSPNRKVGKLNLALAPNEQTLNLTPKSQCKVKKIQSLSLQLNRRDTQVKTIEKIRALLDQVEASQQRNRHKKRTPEYSEDLAPTSSPIKFN
ncbi:MAG: hypothetical protein ACON5A_02530 [Candidatus Comchoanobacterales bacterium]